MRKKNKWRCKRQMKADIRWLDDPQVFRVNRLDAHSDHKFYENKEDYKKQDQRLKQSLNGICIRGKDIFTEDRQDMEKKKGKVCSARPNIIR